MRHAHASRISQHCYLLAGRSHFGDRGGRGRSARHSSSKRHLGTYRLCARKTSHWPEGAFEKRARRGIPASLARELYWRCLAPSLALALIRVRALGCTRTSRSRRRRRRHEPGRKARTSRRAPDLAHPTRFERVTFAFGGQGWADYYCLPEIAWNYPT